MVRFQSFVFVVALGLIALTVQSSAHAAAGASVEISGINCTLNTASGPMAVTPLTSSSVPWTPSSDFGFCESILNPGEFLTIGAFGTYTVFDEGLTGSLGGFFSPHPFDAFFDGTVPAGFEWAAISVLVGKQFDPRSTPAFWSATYDVLNVSTNQDALPDTISNSWSLSGTAYLLCSEPHCASLVDLRVDAISYAQSGIAAAIPEPEIYALMLAGLGLMGFVSRRREQKVAA